MIRKIVLENFMSHKRTVIEPAEGLTVLTGPNNCGKSAVVVALQILCENSRGSAMFVRHGEKEARITVETGEGHTIGWARNKSVSYKVDGREVGRSVTPEDLHEKLRLPQVDVPGGDPVDIHFAEQKDPIFLINDKGGGRAARFFSAASDAALLMKMQQLHKKRADEHRGEMRGLLREIDEAEREMVRFEGVDSMERRMAGAIAAYEKLSADLAAAERLYGLREAIHDSSARKSDQEEFRKSLASLEPSPAMRDTSGLSSVCRDIARRSKEAGEASSRRNALKAVKALPSFVETGSLALLIDQIQHGSARARKLGETVELAARISPPPSLASTEPLESLLEGIKRHRRATASNQAAAQESAQLLANLRTEIERFAKANPTCPVCGGKIDPAKLLTTHAHGGDA